MWFFTDVADWWDEKKQEASKYLHEFVDEHDSWWAIAIAGSVETAMRLGGGFVDVLRLGDGVRQGTARGILQDGLRVLSLAGPVARLGRGIARFVAPNPSGGICAWVSATQALRQTGVQHLATIEDIAAAAGKVPKGLSMVELEETLTSVGADVRPLAAPADMAAVSELAQANPHGVVMFGLKWINSRGQVVRHCLYAFRNILGRVRIIDRSGRSVSALSELADLYPGIETAQTTVATFVKNAQIVQLMDGASAAAVEVRALMLANRETADAQFAHFRTLRAAGHSARTAAAHGAFTATDHHAAAAAHLHKPGASKTAVQPVKPGVNTPNSRGVPAHPVVVVKAGDTWESILRPFYNSRSGIPFQTFVNMVRGANRFANPHVPERGPLKPGMRVVIY